ncbi:flagellar assembly protein FliH [Halomonas elongata]|uniref:Flagellar assembly protein FliH n=1 Tax=Halomonas elongata TaxID=2746 RepID=A0A1B8NZM1_HALEL|nr:FliH/SctL family protein [Halomonas elongata]OBX35403.1 flagellar assembly protein FliH [Halomonas elongata]
MSDDTRHARDTAAIATWRRWRMGELRAEREDVVTEAESDATQARRQEAQRQQEALDALREQVRRDAYEEGLRQGREAGHAEGLAQGREEAQQEADAAFERRLEEEITPLRELTRQFDEALATLDDTIADDLVELALATGRQLAGEALKTRPRQVLELVRALLHTDPRWSASNASGCIRWICAWWRRPSATNSPPPAGACNPTTGSVAAAVG